MSKRWCREAADGGRLAVWMCLIAAAPLLTGCTVIKSLLVQTAPTIEKVAPEFNRLPGKTIVVYVWAPPEILWDYPKIRLDVAYNLGLYLQENVQDVTVVDPRRVESYIEKSNRFDLEPVEVGRHFRAEMVVHLAIYHFSTRDPGMAHFYRGRIGSSVVVHDLSRPDEPPERIQLQAVEVAVPEESRAIGLTNTSPVEVRQLTYAKFTEEAGRKFHPYEKEVN